MNTSEMNTTMIYNSITELTKVKELQKRLLRYTTQMNITAQVERHFSIDPIWCRLSYPKSFASNSFVPTTGSDMNRQLIDICLNVTKKSENVG